MSQEVRFYRIKIPPTPPTLKEFKKRIESLDDEGIEKNFDPLDLEFSFIISSDQESISKHLEANDLILHDEYRYFSVNEPLFEALKIEISSVFYREFHREKDKVIQQEDSEKLFKFAKWCSAIEKAYDDKILVIEAS
jgi:hypothetical protein